MILYGYYGHSPSLLQQTVNTMVILNSDQPGHSRSLLQQTVNIMVRLHTDQLGPSPDNEYYS